MGGLPEQAAGWGAEVLWKPGEPAGFAFGRTSNPIYRDTLKFFRSFPITGLTAVDEPDGVTSLNDAKKAAGHNRKTNVSGNLAENEFQLFLKEN
jgi:hypothetical protein